MKLRGGEKATRPPSERAILERAFSLVNEAMHTFELQRRRLRSNEPEDEKFIFRWWADLQFLIIALRRLRRAAELAKKVPLVTTAIAAALKEFDEVLPMLSMMRNVGEHIDDYAVDSPRRRHKQIHRKLLQIGSWDGTTYQWLDEELNIDTAFEAAKRLYSAVRAALKTYPAKEKTKT